MRVSKLVKDALFLLQDLQENGPQESWDWPADERFARCAMQDAAVADLLHACIESHTVVPVLIDTVRIYADHVRRRRLRALRFLIKQGKVKAQWAGTGERGVHNFGVNRARDYRLVQMQGSEA